MSFPQASGIQSMEDLDAHRLLYPSLLFIPLHSLLQPLKGHLISPRYMHAILETTLFWHCPWEDSPYTPSIKYVTKCFHQTDGIFFQEEFWLHVPITSLLKRHIYKKREKMPIIVLAQCMQVPFSLPLSVGLEVPQSTLAAQPCEKLLRYIWAQLLEILI